MCALLSLSLLLLSEYTLYIAECMLQGRGGAAEDPADAAAVPVGLQAHDALVSVCAMTIHVCNAISFPEYWTVVVRE